MSRGLLVSVRKVAEDTEIIPSRVYNLLEDIERLEHVK